MDDKALHRGPRHRIRRSRSRRWARRAAVVTACLVGVVALVAGAGLYYVHYRYSQIHKVSVTHLRHDQPSSQPQTILLVGNNTRCALNGKQANAFGTCSEVGGGRSDVTMLLHVNPETRQVAVLSIPRDLWLPVPGTQSELRVDAALNQGPGFLVQTIEQDLGIPIDHYVSLNFDTFQAVVDDLGGIQMFFPVPVKDAYSALNIPQAGCQHLDGFQALSVVRARHMYYLQDGYWHYDGLGDLSRIERDHEFMKVLASQVSARGLSNPLTANALIGSVAPQLEVDSGFSLGDMVSLLLTFHSVDPALVPTYTLPVVVDPNSYYYRGYNYGDVVFPEQPADQQAIAQFLGIPAPAPATTQGVTAQVLNGSGRYDVAGALAAQLAARGYQVSSTGNTQVVGEPAETVIRYPPGQVAAAEQLMGQLAGSVALAQGSAGSPLVLVAGSALSVSPLPTVPPPSAPAGASGAPGTTSSAASTTVPPATVPPTTTTTNPAGAATPASRPLASYDPTACPAAPEPRR